MSSFSSPDGARSFRGKSWRIREAPRGAHVDLRNRGLEAVIARILAGRGVDGRGVEDYLEPTIRNLMPYPFFLKDMDKAARRIAAAIRDREPIGIWSDYDADGACSAGILGNFLKMFGFAMFHPEHGGRAGPGSGLFMLRIPDRIREGYGPNAPGLLAMKQDCGFGLVCCLDAGIVAFDPLTAAAEAGMEVIVLDHHMAEDRLPPGVAIVNPNRRDQAEGLGHLCAGGVTFLFCVAVARELRQGGYFDGKEGRPAEVPDLMALLDLVALATVCDVMVLKTLNRAFVRRGLACLTRRQNPGIAALALVAGIDPAAPITEKDCGWVLGPRINAGGRIGDSASGALLLLEDDPDAARVRAEALHAINVERKELEQAATESAMAQMSGRSPGTDRSIALAVVEAHEGIVGISAGRLKEQFDAPAIVLTEDHEGNLKGSARSVPGFDIGHAIIEAAADGVILRGGGHGMAGGLTLRKDQLDGLRAFMNRQIEASDYFRTGVVTDADLALRLGDISVPVVTGFDRLRPFGNGNPEPVIILSGVAISAIRILKEKHLKLTLGDDRQSIDGLMWNVADTGVGEMIRQAQGSRVDVLGALQVNEFRGKKSLQILIEDMRHHGQTLV